MLKIISNVETKKTKDNLSLLEAQSFEMVNNKELSLGGLLIEELNFLNGKITKVVLTNKNLDFSKANMTVVLELKKKLWYPTLIKIPDVSLFTFLSFRTDLQYFLKYLGYEVEDHEFYNHIKIDNKVYKLFDTTITTSEPSFTFSIDKGITVDIDQLVNNRLLEDENSFLTSTNGSEREAYDVCDLVYEIIYGNDDSDNECELDYSLDYDEHSKGMVCNIKIPKKDHEGLGEEIKEEVTKTIKSYQRTMDFLKRVNMVLED